MRLTQEQEVRAMIARPSRPVTDASICCSWERDGGQPPPGSQTPEQSAMNILAGVAEN
jgi:hypothetical protein